MRRVLYVVLCLVLAAAAVGLGSWLVLEPPALEVPEAEALVFTNVTLVTPGGVRRVGETLFVRDGRVQAGDGGDQDAGLVLHQYSGKYLLPGLVDMHVHLPIHTKLLAILFLAHGVTSVRDVGSLTGATLELRRAILEGEHPGPRIFSCGRPLDGDPPVPGRGNQPVASVEEAHAAVAELAAAGVACIKVYDNLRADVLDAIATAAAEHGLPVVGHVPVDTLFEYAPIADVQHLTGLARERDTGNDPGPMRGLRDLEPQRLARFVASSRERGIAHTPTLTVLAAMARADPARPIEAARWLPRWLPEVYWSRAQRDLTPQVRASWSDALDVFLDATGRLHEAGVRIHAGTDMLTPFQVAGESLHRELALLVEAGLTLEQAWVAATLTPAAMLDAVEPSAFDAGAPADLLVFGSDPTRDLAALDSLEAVVAQGRLYPRALLQSYLVRYRDFYRSGLVDGLTMALARGALTLDDQPAPPGD